MPRTASKVKVGKRVIELSNLNKVLFPQDNIIKAELLDYYLRIAPTILRHIKGRPLSLVRFPDGIDGESFFQKNLPDWTPEWIDRIALGDSERIEYAIASEDATLVWLANLACIELHQIHARKPNVDYPDYIVFDIDPPPNYSFPKVVDLAVRLRELVEDYGYHPFVKTTGGKGVHIVAPIEPQWDFDQARDATLEVAKDFIGRNTATTTLQIKKDARGGKVFIDVYRNRRFQTIISPYSVRGRPGAPVSMPLNWAELEALKDPSELGMGFVLDHVMSEGDPWEAIGAYAVKLHMYRERSSPAAEAETAGPAPATKRSKAGNSKPESGPHEAAATGQNPPSHPNDPPGSRRFQRARLQPLKETPGALSEYARKRSFSMTPEPPPAPETGEGNAFVVHRHHASRLHYDLRLERDGTLRCWAVPKGLPPRPGIKRLAVAVEDHPLSYIDFEGEIPHGQYGGGLMWVYATGKYDIIKEKKDGFYFRLRSPEVNAEYRIINTKDKDWLLERLDQPQVDWVRDPIAPMLAEPKSAPFDSPEYLYEVKWDGIRALISLDEGELTIRSRNLHVITERFPELNIPERALRATSALFDAEIICPDETGRPVFERVIRRLQQTGESAITRLSAKYPAVCYVFDCLYLDGRSVINEPLVRRREWVADAVRENTPYRASEAMDDGMHLYEAASALGLEGIVAKLRNSPYLPGKRSESWLKIKTRRTIDCIIVGYTRGKGAREDTFGALQLGCYKDGKLEYVGGLGTGFDDAKLKSLRSDLEKLETVPNPFTRKILDSAQTVWVEPKVVCEVKYTAFTEDHQLRHAVFVRMRPDKTPEDCVIE
ncbi:MAG TPA: non-homologous end-joining DNA ligase [Blastocatellia bacterium]|nr:non-homologous end-joining DNA ligase [Blastocatellia bacterium]